MYGRGREGKLGGEISSSALYGSGCLCRVIKVTTFHIRKGNPSCLKRMYSSITWKDRKLINKWPIHWQVIEITSSKRDCSHISLQRGWVQQGHSQPITTGIGHRAVNKMKYLNGSLKLLHQIFYSAFSFDSCDSNDRSYVTVRLTYSFCHSLQCI